MSLKYEMYRDEKDIVIVGSVVCSSCLNTIGPYNAAIYLESWHNGYGFREAVVCGPGCAEKHNDLKVGHHYEIPVLVVKTKPDGAVRKVPEPPERGSPMDLTEASDYFSGGAIRYESRVNKADFMDMKGQKPLIPAQDAKGVSLSDLRSAQAEGRLPTIEEDLAELDLIFSAVPIDAHSQVEGDEKKRLEDSR